MLRLALAIFVLPATLAWGQEIRFEHDSLYVRLREGAALPAHPLIRGSETLFEQVLRLDTPDALALENDLLYHPDVEWAEKSFYAGRRELPTLRAHRVAKSTHEEASRYAGFDDSQVNRLWSFEDSARGGASVARYYADTPVLPEATVVVAVVDTGVDYEHEDLKNRMWVNADEIPGNGLDDDDNGYVDDVHGINLLQRSRHGDPRASNSHGTHVAGTIAAEAKNGVGIAGVSSQARIMAIRAVPDEGDETDRNVVDSLLYAARNGAKIVNCSFGKKNSPDRGRLVGETIRYVGERHGVLVVAAAGNDSRPGSRPYSIDRHRDYPAGLSNEHLLVVAASRLSGGLAEFSNVGRVNVDVAAPGERIYSTLPRDSYGYSDGTSMAAPLVSGIAAQIMAAYPALSPLQVKSAIMESVRPESAFLRYMSTGGRVDMAEALRNASRR